MTLFLKFSFSGTGCLDGMFSLWCIAHIEKLYKTQYNMKIQTYSMSKKGTRNYDNMENQDTFFTFDCGKFKMYGIFDGTGEHGKLIS